MQLAGKFEIVATGRPVESKIAAVDDEIGTPGVDVFADPMKILGQGRQAAGKVGVGNLDQAKFGHATFLPLRLYILTEVGTMTKFWKAVQSCHRCTAVIIREGG
jgi:hypothetical protein